MKRLYADFNDFSADGSLPLTSAGSLESIAAYESALQEGEEVWLSDGELGVMALVSRATDGAWIARSDWAFTTEQQG